MVKHMHMRAIALLLAAALWNIAEIPPAVGGPNSETVKESAIKAAPTDALRATLGSSSAELDIIHPPTCNGAQAGIRFFVTDAQHNESLIQDVALGQSFRVAVLLPAREEPGGSADSSKQPESLDVRISSGGQEATLRLTADSAHDADGLRAYRTQQTVSIGGKSEKTGFSVNGVINEITHKDGQALWFSLPDHPKITGVLYVWDDEYQLAVNQMTHALSAIADKLIVEQTALRFLRQSPAAAKNEKLMADLDHWQGAIDRRMAAVAEGQRLIKIKKKPIEKLAYGEFFLHHLLVGKELVEDYDAREYYPEFSRIGRSIKEKLNDQVWEEVIKAYAFGLADQLTMVTLAAPVYTLLSGENIFGQKSSRLQAFVQIGAAYIMMKLPNAIVKWGAEYNFGVPEVVFAKPAGSMFGGFRFGGDVLVPRRMGRLAEDSICRVEPGPEVSTPRVSEVSTPRVAEPAGVTESSIRNTPPPSPAARTPRSDLDRIMEGVWENRDNISTSDQVYHDYYSTAPEPHPVTDENREAFRQLFTDLQDELPEGATSRVQMVDPTTGRLIRDPSGRDFAYTSDVIADLGPDALDDAYFIHYRAPDFAKGETVGRVYVRANPDHAPELMTYIVKEIVNNPAFEGVNGSKISGVNSAGTRSDNILIYTRNAEATAAVISDLRGYQSENPTHFLEGTPPMTLEHAPGIATGMQPVGGGSFGGVRSQAVFDALTETRGLISADGANPRSDTFYEAYFRERVAQHLESHRVDPNNPDQNLSGAQYILLH